MGARRCDPALKQGQPVFCGVYEVMLSGDSVSVSSVHIAPELSLVFNAVAVPLV